HLFDVPLKDLNCFSNVEVVFIVTLLYRLYPLYYVFVGLTSLYLWGLISLYVYLEVPGHSVITLWGEILNFEAGFPAYIYLIYTKINMSNIYITLCTLLANPTMDGLYLFLNYLLDLILIPLNSEVATYFWYYEKY